MRKLSDVIDAILPLLPAEPDPAIADNITVLAAELRILRRTGSYTAPEASDDAALYTRLSSTLYRYLPAPTAYTWAQAISDVVTQVAS